MATKKKCDCDELDRSQDRWNTERLRHRTTRRATRKARQQVKEMRGYLEQAARAIEKLCTEGGNPEMAALIAALRWQAFPPKAVR